MAARTRRPGWCPVSAATVSRVRVPAKAAAVRRSGRRWTAMSVKASGTATRVSQASAASSQPDETRAATSASAIAAASSAASGYGLMRARQAGQRPVTGSTGHHRQRPGRIGVEQSGHSRRGGSPALVLSANTTARIGGPASRPRTAPAMTQGSVTVPSFGSPSPGCLAERRLTACPGIRGKRGMRHHPTMHQAGGTLGRTRGRRFSCGWCARRCRGRGWRAGRGWSGVRCLG